MVCTLLQASKPQYKYGKHFDFSNFIVTDGSQMQVVHALSACPDDFSSVDCSD